MARGARVLQLFLGKGEFALLPVGPSARVAASCTASDSNQNSYALVPIAKRSRLRRLGRLKTQAYAHKPTRPRTKSWFLRTRKSCAGVSGRRFDEYRLSSVNGSLHKPRRARGRSYWHGSLAGDAVDATPSTRPLKPTRRLLPDTGRTT